MTDPAHHAASSNDAEGELIKGIATTCSRPDFSLDGEGKVGVTVAGLFVIGSAAVAAIADYRNLAAAGTTRRGPAAFLPFDAWPQPGGLIRTTTVAGPARGSVVLAKATVMTALWTAVGTVVSTGSFLVSQAVLDGRHAGVPITPPVCRGRSWHPRCRSPSAH
ncbi:hypothetical protein [Streptomyces sp. NPDC004546]|uniref:hypothetical protein n=1 Tax=Streptomyces sp. NPDC004546 TaxID=3154282 RepID=UPI0033ADD2BD